MNAKTQKTTGENWPEFAYIVFIVVVALSAFSEGDASGQVAYLKLDETSSLVAHDSSGNDNHGALIEQMTDNWCPTDGKVSGALKYIGSSRVTLDNPTVGESANGTFEAWFNIKTGDALFSKRYDSDPDSANFYGVPSRYLGVSANYLEFRIFEGYKPALPTEHRIQTDSDETGGLTDEQWHHVAATWGSRGMEIFLDGHLRASDPSYTGCGEPSNIPLDVGDDQSDYLIVGSIGGFLDEVAIYSTQLSWTDINRHYQNGWAEPPAGYDVFDSDGDGYLSHVDCDDSDATVNPGATELPGDGIDNDCDGYVDNAPCGPVSWWPGDGHADDVVGGNDGIPGGGVTYAQGFIGQAFQFDGIGEDDVVWAPAEGIDILQRFTMNAWVRLDVMEHDEQRFVTLCDKAVLRHDGFSSFGQLHFCLNVGDDYPNDDLHDIRVSDILQTGEFFHVAGTYDGTWMRMYLNGVEVGNHMVVGTLRQTGRNVGLSWPDEPMAGLLDEVAIHNCALGAEEIWAIFRAGAGEGYTPAGVDVVVQPVDPATETQPVMVTFGEVAYAGITSLTSTSSGLEPPTGFELAGVTYDIITTASYAPPVTVCIQFDNTGMTLAQEETLRLYHYDGMWIDITDPPVDTVNHTVCGTADFLSPFGVFVDTTVPTITDVSASPDVLWPPNHKAVEVLISGRVKDAGTGLAQVDLVVEDEYEELSEELYDITDLIDEEGWFALPIDFIAWRNGDDLDGRHYAIRILALDAAGNEVTTEPVFVIVPHDQDQGKGKK